ncbi:peroxiredoxin family protein [Pontibacter sp. CAU 1760]
MKKGIIIVVLALLALALIVFLDVRKTSSSAEEEVAVESPTQTQPTSNDLPMLPMLLQDGSRVIAKNLKGKTVLVLYQPDCDHCQREATQIQENLEAFEGYKVYFVSDAGFAQQRQFAETYKLADLKNVHFATTTINDILEQVGPIEAPSLFVYSEEGRLVKSFIGETPIEQILPVL